VTDSSHTPYRVSPNGSELTVSFFSLVDYWGSLVAPRLRPLFEHFLMRPPGEGALNGWCSPTIFDRTIHRCPVIWLTLWKPWV